jgi:hypothetical protein
MKTLASLIVVAVITALNYLAYFVGIEWSILLYISFIIAVICLVRLPYYMETTTGMLCVVLTFFACLLPGLYLAQVLFTWWNFISFAAAGTATFIALRIWQRITPPSGYSF